MSLFTSMHGAMLVSVGLLPLNGSLLKVPSDESPAFTKVDNRMSLRHLSNDFCALILTRHQVLNLVWKVKLTSRQES